LRARTRRLVSTIAGVTLASAAFGVVVSSFTPTGVFTGLLAGTAIGLVLAMLGVSTGGEAVRRWPVAVVLLLRTVVYGAVFLVIPTAMFALVQGSLEPFRHPLSVVTGTTLALSFGFGLIINFALTVTRLLGPPTVMSFITGRYHRPRREQRIVLFLDLAESTNLAEKLGDARFHGFLNRVFWDITEPVLEAGGEFYRYVGDEVIVTWTERAGAAGAAVACIFAIEDALARRRDDYLTCFGAAPRFRAALHAGPLVVGEMGDVKREIVLLGDTMNTAARIENVCRASGHDFIASAPAMPRREALPPNVRAESLGAVELRGKEIMIELFALTRSPTVHAGHIPKS
jgi:adenylate cyclase